MTIKLVKKIRRLTKNEKIIDSATIVVESHKFIKQIKYKLIIERQIYQMLLAKRLVRELRPLIHETSEKIRVLKKQVKNAERQYQKHLASFTEIARKNALEIACKPTPQAISRIMRGF